MCVSSAKVKSHGHGLRFQGYVANEVETEQMSVFDLESRH